MIRLCHCIDPFVREPTITVFLQVEFGHEKKTFGNILYLKIHMPFSAEFKGILTN